MLVENTLFGLQDKVQIAIDRIGYFEPPEGYCFEDSFGKDSTVVDHLLKMAEVQFDSHFCFTSVDPPELIKYGKRVRPYVIFERPENTMWHLIAERNLPTRINRFCCSYLKEWHGSGRLVVTGIRWQESVKRRKRMMVETCYKDTTKTFLNPIIDWTTDDVWEFIKQEHLEVCELYHQGFKRIGCIGCPMQAVKTKKRDFDRYPNFKRAYLHAMQKNMDTRKTPSKFADVEEWFDWWVSDKRRDIDKTDLFSHFE